MSNEQNASIDVNKEISNTSNRVINNDNFSSIEVEKDILPFKRNNSWPVTCCHSKSASDSEFIASSISESSPRMRASYPGPSSSSTLFSRHQDVTVIDIEPYNEPIDYRVPDAHSRRRPSSVEHTPPAVASTANNNSSSRLGLGSLVLRLMRGSLARRLSTSPTASTATTSALSATGNSAIVANYASTMERDINAIAELDPRLANLLMTHFQTADVANRSNGDGSAAAPTSTAGDGTSDDATPDGQLRNDANNSIPQLRILLESREAIYQYFCQNYTEFPNLLGFNITVLSLVVFLILLTQFVVTQFNAVCVFFFAFMHYHDASRFMRCVSGASDVYVPLASVLLRNALIIFVFDKRLVFSVVTFHDEISALFSSNIFSVLYRVIVTELFVMDVALVCKLLMAKIPFISKVYKRRVYQWMEYTSALYRYPIPLVQWCAFIGSTPWIVVYCIVKLFLGFPVVWSWSRTTLRLFRHSHLGTSPTIEELKHAEQCTICYSEFTAPIKLKCGHIFDSDCIRTWLDREVTCPICRATVSKEDNHYRNGNSIFPMHIF